MEYEFSSQPRPARILFTKDDKPDLKAGTDMGPIDLSDVSQGPVVQRWTVTAEPNGDVHLRSQDGKDYMLFNDITIVDIDVTFDQLGREVIAYKNGDGIYIWHYSVELAQMTHKFIGIGDDPRISMDLKHDITGLNDVIMWYRVGTTARRRLQRYRYDAEHEVTAPNFSIIRLKACGMAENGRFVVVGETIKEDEEIVHCDDNWIYRTFQLDVDSGEIRNSGAYDVALIEHGTPSIYEGDISFNNHNVLQLDGSSYLETDLPETASNWNTTANRLALSGWFRFDTLLNEPIVFANALPSVGPDWHRTVSVTADGVLTYTIYNNGSVADSYSWQSSTRIFLNDWVRIGIQVDDNRRTITMTLNQEVESFTLAGYFMQTGDPGPQQQITIGGSTIAGRNLTGYVGAFDVDYEVFDTELVTEDVASVSIAEWVNYDTTGLTTEVGQIQFSGWEAGDLAIVMFASERADTLRVGVDSEESLWNNPYVTADNYYNFPRVYDAAGTELYQRESHVKACADASMSGALNVSWGLLSGPMPNDAIVKYQAMHIKGAHIDGFFQQGSTEFELIFDDELSSQPISTPAKDIVGKQGWIEAIVSHDGSQAVTITFASDTHPDAIIQTPAPAATNNFNAQAFLTYVPADLRIEITPAPSLIYRTNARDNNPGHVAASLKFVEVGKPALHEDDVEYNRFPRIQCNVEELPSDWLSMWDQTNYDASEEAWVGNSGRLSIRSYGLWPIGRNVETIRVYCTAYQEHERIYLYSRDGVPMGISQFVETDATSGHAVFDVHVDAQEGAAVGFLAFETNATGVPGPYVHRIEVAEGTNRMRILSTNDIPMLSEGLNAYTNQRPNGLRAPHHLAPKDTTAILSIPSTEEELDNWTIVEGSMAKDHIHGASSPADNGGYLLGGGQARSIGYRQMSLEELLGAGRTVDRLTISWMQSSWEGRDAATMGIAFIVDGVATAIEAPPEIAAESWGTWISRSQTSQVPEGATDVRFYYTATRGTGVSLDGMVTNITISVDGNQYANDQGEGNEVEMVGAGIDFNNGKLAIIVEAMYGSIGVGISEFGINDVITVTSERLVGTDTYRLTITDTRGGSWNADYTTSAGDPVHSWVLVWDGSNFAVFNGRSRVLLVNNYPTDVISGPITVWGHGLAAGGTGVDFVNLAVTKDIDAFTEAMTVDNDNVEASPSFNSALGYRIDTLYFFPSLDPDITGSSYDKVPELIKRYNP